MVDPYLILKSSKNILLVDWPNPSFPRTLLLAGFDVYCFSPSKYTQASIVSLPPVDKDGGSIFPPANNEEHGYLTLRQLKDKPTAIDIVCVYRPVQELPGILEGIVFPLGAKTVWIQPPVVSTETRILAEKNGLNYVENYAIEEVIKALRDRT